MRRNVDWQASRIHLDHLFTVAVTTRDSEYSKLGVEPQGKKSHRMIALKNLLDDLGNQRLQRIVHHESKPCTRLHHSI